MAEEQKDNTQLQPETHATHTLADDIEQAKKTGKVVQAAPSAVEAVHTLSSDLTHALYEKKGTFVKLALAEEEKRRMLEEGREPYSKQNIFFIAASALLVLAGIGLLTFFYIKAHPTVQTQNTLSLPTYVFTDGNITVPLEEKTQDQARTAVKDAFASLQPAEIVAGIYPTSGDVLLSLSQFASAIGVTIPESVSASVSSVYMLGAHRAGEVIVPFLILKTSSEEDTRNAMRAWEPTLYETFARIVLTEVNQSLVSEPFGNAIIRNKDARVLRDANGEIVLLYTFIDKQTLLLATIPDTVAMAIERLNVERVVQ